jgi:hypothetical protein
MIRRGMTELTGAPNQATAWNQLFQKGDVVGIKVNPNAIPSPISSPAVINEILQGLLGAGVTRNDIMVCDRNRVQLNTIAGWLPSWVRLDAASWEWSTDQTEVGGYNPNKMSGVSGYNPSYRGLSKIPASLARRGESETYTILCRPIRHAGD